MGTWGEGNFENDGALDYLGEIVDSLAKEIDTILSTNGAADADQDGESRLVPSVAMIDALCERFNGAPPNQKRSPIGAHDT